MRQWCIPVCCLVIIVIQRVDANVIERDPSKLKDPIFQSIGLTDDRYTLERA